MKRFTPFLILWCFAFGANSQDLHFSMFFNSPLNLNPALTGQFIGDQRLHANYRRQWFNWPVENQNLTVGGDFKLKNSEKPNFLSLGALLNYDVAGDLNTSLTGLDAFGSYSIKVGNGYLTPGLNIGFGVRSFNTSNALLGEFWDGNSLTPGVAADPIHQGSDGLDKLYVDANVGLNYRQVKTFRKFFDLGISANNLISPDVRFDQSIGVESNLLPKFNIYGMGNWQVADKIDLLLNALVSLQNPYQEIVLNGQGKFYLNDQYSRALYLGAGIRLDDSWYPMIALEIDKLYVAFSYDLDIKEVQKGGGPEFAVRYIFAALPIAGKKPCPIY